MRPDRLADLERLKALWDAGALTEDEYSAEKRALLSSGRRLTRVVIPAASCVVLLLAVSAAYYWFHKPSSAPQPSNITQDDLNWLTQNDIEPTAAPSPPDPYEGAFLDGCRQGSCSWTKILGVRTVKNATNGVLKVETTYEGTSDDSASEESRVYSPGRGIKWEKDAVETYVFCSKQQPSIAFKDRWDGGSGKWYGHLLDLFNTYGYNGSSAATYTRVCHHINFDRADIDPVLRRLGYLPGTRNEQVELDTPEQLANPPSDESADDPFKDN